MRVRICAVGRMKSGPERALVDDYTTRFDRTGRALGLGPLTISEVDDRKGGGMAAEAALLDRAIPDGAVICAMDERGREMTSPDFAQMLFALEEGVRCREIAFVIGGADGIDPALRIRTDAMLSFGPMVWPHMLVRAMLCEQLYRAASILAGSPYHRV